MTFTKGDMLKSVTDSLKNFENFGFGEREEKIINAMRYIDRKDFMPEEAEDTYADRPAYIGYGQTISQPSTVARMLSLLELKAGNSVLEIGTGSGWNAALIGYIVGEQGRVVSYEVIKELAERAREKIKKYKLKNVEIKIGDFRNEKERFDRIIFTAGIDIGQENFIENFASKALNENGILICPYRSGLIIIIKKSERELRETRTAESYVFVPLVLD